MKLKVVTSVVLTALLSLSLSPMSASAAPCPPSKTNGATIGKIQVGGVSVNLKNVNYPKGGVLVPPSSPLNAGLSARHMPLDSQLGTSVITWHVNLNGCEGKLNVLSKKEIGYEFSVTDQNGNLVVYRITEKVIVKKGNYEEEWFDLSGPRKLLLVTCIGKVVNGSYQKNLVLQAEPVA